MDTAEALARLDFVAESRSDFLFVCEQDDRVIAVLGFRFRENVEQPGRYGEISALVVDPDRRRQGVGRFMMSFAEVMAEHEGCVGTWLVSGLGREEDAHVFYRGLGYQVTGYRFVKPRDE
jgi:GNAT superfamily N-acetyltransferase